MVKEKKERAVILGCGAAGLGCAYELLKQNKNLEITLIDKNDKVGGLARSYNTDGIFFDIGPHRFYTKNDEVLALWKLILGKDLLKINRLTRIFYKNKLFLYPVQIKDVLTKLGLRTSFVSLVSFLNAKIFLARTTPKTFEQWIIKNFGEKLYSIFFKTYTEKVWGIACNKIGAEWAAQRIKNLNFIEVIKNALFTSESKKAKSLVDKFYYPSQGSGFFYEKLANEISLNGGKILLNSSVKQIKHRSKKIILIEYVLNKKRYSLELDYLFSSLPITNFIQFLNPQPEKAIINYASKLYYRDHITINFTVRNINLFPDNWIYIHSPDVKIARITNYNNFKKNKRNKVVGISIEYFTFKKDDVWKMTDNKIIEFAKHELKLINLFDVKNILKGYVIRETESYPTYFMGYQTYFNNVKSYVSEFKNFQSIGRGGMYRYNNMDHATYSGMLAARNYISGKQNYNVWNINEDAEYLEEK